MIKYICCLIILFIIFFVYCHINKLKTINNTLNILQTSDPDQELAYELFEQHQPIVFQRELYFWKEFNKLINKSLPDIKATISNNTGINYTDIIKVNMEPYNIPLSYEWNIDIRNIILDDKNGIFFNITANIAKETLSTEDSFDTNNPLSNNSGIRKLAAIEALYSDAHFINSFKNNLYS